MPEEVKDPEVIARKWRHRRRMAYTALLSVIGLTLLIIGLAATERTGELSDFSGLLVTVTGGLITLVGAYMGVATWYEVRR